MAKEYRVGVWIGMDKTIKELADELGVSKQAIRKHLDKLPPTLPVTKVKGTIYLSAEVVDFVKSRVNVVTSKVDIGVTDNVTRGVDSNLLDQIAFLESQINVKDEQLEIKDKQLNQVHKLLDQQQVLTLQANKKIEELEYQVEEKNGKEEMVSDELEKEIEKKIREKQPKGFFSRLFGKK